MLSVPYLKLLTTMSLGTHLMSESVLTDITYPKVFLYIRFQIIVFQI